MFAISWLGRSIRACRRENKIWHAHQEEGSFKAVEARYTAVDQVDIEDLERWLAKARDIQWNYRNLIRRKGRLERLK